MLNTCSVPSCTHTPEVTHLPAVPGCGHLRWKGLSDVLCISPSGKEVRGRHQAVLFQQPTSSVVLKPLWAPVPYLKESDSRKVTCFSGLADGKRHAQHSFFSTAVTRKIPIGSQPSWCFCKANLDLQSLVCPPPPTSLLNSRLLFSLTLGSPVSSILPAVSWSQVLVRSWSQALIKVHTYGQEARPLSYPSTHSYICIGV